MNTRLSDKIFDCLILIYVVFVLLIVLYPLIFILSSSFSSPDAVMAGKVFLLPVDFSISGYKAVMQNAQIWLGFKNSFFYAAASVFVNLLLTSIAAYPLSQKDFRFRNAIMYLFAFTMFFSGGLIPTYFVVRSIGLVNTPMAMFLPNAMSVFNVILMRTYIQTSIPSGLQEAARIDGCSDMRYFSNILIPLCKPILAVIALFVAVASWNAYFSALIYLTDEKLFPLQIILRSILVLNQFDPQMLNRIVDVEAMQSKLGLQALLKYALIVVSSAPILMLYPFVQKYFVKGITLGAIKG